MGSSTVKIWPDWLVRLNRLLDRRRRNGAQLGSFDPMNEIENLSVARRKHHDEFIVADLAGPGEALARPIIGILIV